MKLIAASYIGLGCWFLESIDTRPDIKIINENYKLMGALMLSAGLAAIFLSFFGCVVSIWRNLYSIAAVIYKFCEFC